MRKVLSVCFLLAGLAVATPSLLSEECCEISGDGNDDGVVDIYDYLFQQGYQYDYCNPSEPGDYPAPDCFDQMLWEQNDPDADLWSYYRFDCSDPNDSVLDTLASCSGTYPFVHLMHFLYSDSTYPECGDWEF